MSGWDDVSSAAPQQSQDNSWDSVSAPALPDTSGVQSSVQKNMQSDPETENKDKSPPSFSQQLDKGMGMFVSSAIANPDHDVQLSPEMRKHLTDSYANGTSTDAGDFMQSAIPAATHTITSSAIGSATRGAAKSAIPAAAGYAAFGPAAEAGAMATLPFSELAGPVAPLVPLAGGLISGTAAAMGIGGLAGAAENKLLEKFPNVADKIGLSKEQLVADTEQHPIAQFVGEQVPNLALMRPGNLKPLQMATGAALGGGLEAGREVASGEDLDPKKIAISTAITSVSNKPTKFGELISSSTSKALQNLKEFIGSKIGKPSSAVTQQDIAASIDPLKKSAPTAQDFKDTATVLGVDEKTLHNVYNETGLKPDQIHEDASTNPFIQKDLEEGKIPQAYDHLRQNMAEESGLKQPSITEKKESERNSKVFNMSPTKEDTVNFNPIKDQSGKPITVYHGTDKEFDKFNTTPESSGLSGPQSQLGAYFTTDPERASSYAGLYPESRGRVIPANIQLDNPYYMTRQELSDLTVRHNIHGADDAFISKRYELEKNGYDGIKFERSSDESGTTYAVFNSDKIKSIFDKNKEQIQTKGKSSDLETSASDENRGGETPQSPEGGSASINPFGHIFNPAGQSEASADMATAIRQGRGPAAHETAVISENMQKYSKDINALSDNDKLDLIHYIETRSGEDSVPLKNPKLQVIADSIRDIYSHMADKLKEAFPDAGLREDYFTHQYKDKEAARKFYNDFVAKQGSERNLQEREFPTLREAMSAGLEPKTTNPLETVMNYVRNMNNLIAAHKSLEIAREGGIADYFKKGQQPEGWVPLKGNLEEKEGKRLYAPEDAARVYNNDISEKATGPIGSILDAVQKGTNFVDKLVLGLSGYHFTATTMASMSSDVGRALTGGTAEERASDVDSAATILPFKNLSIGKDIEEAYLGKGSLTPELQKALDLAIKNNSINIKQQDYWKAGPAKDWVDSFKNGTILSEVKAAGEEIKQKPLTGTAKAILTTLGKTMDTISKPLFDVYIPRIKNAALIQETHDWLQSHPEATEAQKDKAVQDIGNSIDNRFGEMMRDNLFWHQYTRQTLQTALLSYSWVTGAARMLGGVTDAGMAMVGKKELSSNARYLFGMAATYAIVNGVRSYIGTGQPPDDWKDFVYPKTGGTTPQGKDERELLPSHIGQFTNYLHEGIGELGNEASPGLKLLYHTLSNKDFRGLPITSDNNEWYSEQRWEDYLKYTFHEIEPIGLKNFIQGQKNGSHISSAESILGARQAPQFITDPEGYEQMMKRINDLAYQRKLRSDTKMQSQYSHEDEDQP